jgi:hypothetical protein
MVGDGGERATCGRFGDLLLSTQNKLPNTLNETPEKLRQVNDQCAIQVPQVALLPLFTGLVPQILLVQALTDCYLGLRDR